MDQPGGEGEDGHGGKGKANSAKMCQTHLCVHLFPCAAQFHSNCTTKRPFTMLIASGDKRVLYAVNGLVSVDCQLFGGKERHRRIPGNPLIRMADGWSKGDR